MRRQHTDRQGPRLPRTVRTLGVVSLLNDLASEMIYPLLPAFVTARSWARWSRQRSSPAAWAYAFGLFHGVTGATLLTASLLTGVLWQMLGAPIALGAGAALAALAGLLLFYVPDSGDAAAAGGAADAGAVALR